MFSLFEIDSYGEAGGVAGALPSRQVVGLYEEVALLLRRCTGS